MPRLASGRPEFPRLITTKSSPLADVAVPPLPIMLLVVPTVELMSGTILLLARPSLCPTAKAILPVVEPPQLGVGAILPRTQAFLLRLIMPTPFPVLASSPVRLSPAAPALPVPTNPPALFRLRSANLMFLSFPALPLEFIPAILTLQAQLQVGRTIAPFLFALPGPPEQASPIAPLRVPLTRLPNPLPTIPPSLKTPEELSPVRHLMAISESVPMVTGPPLMLI